MQISNAESVVMEQLWRDAPLSAEQIVANLADAREWQEATVKTLLNRLLKKGAVSATKDGRRYLYSPCFQRADYVASQSEDLLGRLFGGRLAPLVMHFSERRKLSKRDISDLKKLIGKL
ncbi:MAG TPA: BlaI/MecI/CopY family transcriptional regulator [Patescibacteria group bacterium]|nr:BlaI/MecI/CopY family transcriptional regulator [Patescibacteria group bacterium]